MTEQKNQLASLFAACWKDDALKARFMADPKAVLAEYDMAIPEPVLIPCDTTISSQWNQLQC